MLSNHLCEELEHRNKLNSKYNPFVRLCVTCNAQYFFVVILSHFLFYFICFILVAAAAAFNFFSFRIALWLLLLFLGWLKAFLLCPYGHWFVCIKYLARVAAINTATATDWNLYVRLGDKLNFLLAIIVIVVVHHQAAHYKIETLEHIHSMQCIRSACCVHAFLPHIFSVVSDS